MLQIVKATAWTFEAIGAEAKAWTRGLSLLTAYGLGNLYLFATKNS